jgi:hypothetical protein
MLRRFKNNNFYNFDKLSPSNTPNASHICESPHFLDFENRILVFRQHYDANHGEARCFQITFSRIEGVGNDCGIAAAIIVEQDSA